MFTKEDDYEIDVRKFILENVTPYEGDGSFLQPPTKRTKKLWEKLSELLAEERKRGGMYDIDAKTISTINAHEAGYIDKELEQIVLQSLLPREYQKIRLFAYSQIRWWQNLQWFRRKALPACRLQLPAVRPGHRCRPAYLLLAWNR